MDNSLPNNELNKKYALELYQSQEIRQGYLKKQKQITLQAVGLLLVGATVSVGIFYVAEYITRTYRLFSIIGTIFISIISFSAFMIYQLGAIAARKKDFIRQFKRDVIQKIIQHLYPNLDYSRTGKFDIKKFLLYNRLSNYQDVRVKQTEDCIKGNYNNISFYIIEVTIQGRLDYGGEEIYQNAFNGLVIHIHSDYSKKLLDEALKSAAVQKRILDLSKFWNKDLDSHTFNTGDIMIDFPLSNKHFLEPPKGKLKLYDQVYLEQLQTELKLLVDLIHTIGDYLSQHQ